MYPLQNYTHTTQQRKLIVKVSTEQDWSRLKKLTAECEYKIYNYKYIPKKESNIIIVGTPPTSPLKREGDSDFSHKKGRVGKIGGIVLKKVRYHLFSY